ncbi:MAG TPA: glycine C-acetyltransferase [Methylomirabilota bacterium]|nr:glycine C-acetyltransferase [Methylomirabilota bacterium]
MGLQQRLSDQLAQIRRDALYKDERVIAGPQGAGIHLATGQDVLNFCANNYLGLANHPEIVAAAKQALDDHGFGLASVRFICGTQDLHRELETAIARFFGTDDAILYSSCFDANGGLFETLLDEQDAVISDALNHASIIDGIRLCKAQRLRYRHADMDDLRTQLTAAKSARTRLIATDGVFSMDGDIAPLDRIVQLAREHAAVVMVDDSHATGFVGPTGRGSAEHHGVQGQIDIFTSTLGKALGGGTGGFTTAKQPVIDLLRQRSRPYLFSNSITPSVAAAGIKVFDLLTRTTDLRRKLMDNARYFREHIAAAGFTIKPGIHPIVPVMLGDAALAQKMSAELLTLGIYVIGFSYPVVPKGEARIRVQISAAHERAHLDRAVAAFTQVGRKLGVVT